MEAVGFNANPQTIILWLVMIIEKCLKLYFIIITSCYARLSKTWEKFYVQNNMVCGMPVSYNWDLCRGMGRSPTLLFPSFKNIFCYSLVECAIFNMKGNRTRRKFP